MSPDELARALVSVVADLVAAGELAVAVPDAIRMERPRNPEHGDYASSIALQLAKPAGRPPREVAELVAGRLRAVTGVDRVDVAGPGFLNVTLAADALGEVARLAVAAGPAYAASATLAGRRINLEFVSANPTGPLHLGGTRWAAVGDALARILAASGAAVTREYYFNDHGAQIDRFARSLLAAARDEPAPEDGYGGAYIHDIAAAVIAANPGVLARDDPEAQEIFRHDGVEMMFGEIKASLHEFGVDFDVYFHEDDLHTSGRVGEAITRLRDKGYVYDLDGAVWLRTTDFGDDRDRVLVRSNGEPAYFSGDVAYYLDKRERGFDQVVIMLGADHHGYIGRLRAMVACFGDDPDQTLDILIGQMVNLVRDGEPVKMSKRSGTIITMEDLVEAIGVDAARYALVRSNADSQIDIDLDLWASKASENPVFYVQYAAVRAASIARGAAEMSIAPLPVADVDVALLTHPREQELLLALAELPRVVASAAELREPHRLARYLEEQVARGAQRMFDECRVLPRGDEEVNATTHARLLLWQAVRVVLGTGLGLLGVSAPERM
jgi:arginyl-tRNA synthetase